MKISHDMGMVNIETDNLTYSNIKNMYTENRNGAGLQISENLNDKRDDIGEICDKIANLIYQLNDLTAPETAPSHKPK